MIEVLFTILVTLVLLSVLVLAHEFGHFIAARKFGVVAEEFGLGLPPFARKLFAWKGTDFTLNWLPIGGFVRMRGEDPTSSRDAGLRGAELEKGGFFFAQKPWKRAIILLAGVTMNILLGIFLFSVAYSVLGIPQPGHTVTIDAVSIGSPAEKAGIKPGDIVNDLRFTIYDPSTDSEQVLRITSTNEFVEFINTHRGKEIMLVLKREGKVLEISVTPRLESETPKDEGALGVAVSNIEFVHYPWWQMPVRASWLGVGEAVGWGIQTIRGVSETMTGLLSRGSLPEGVAGPIGIARITGRIARLGWIHLIQFAGILSVNLAIINILPIPALDGGRLLFLGIEKLRGRPVNPAKERWAHLVGYAFLISLLIFVTIKDIWRK